jgi:hypothetical protein
MSSVIVRQQRAPQSSIGLLGSWDLLDKSSCRLLSVRIGNIEREFGSQARLADTNFQLQVLELSSLLRQLRFSPNRTCKRLSLDALLNRGGSHFLLRLNHDL